ncbi:MAG: hypothetical protein WCL28_10600, partial [bacterium]
MDFKLLAVNMSPDIAKKAKTITLNDDPAAVIDPINGPLDESALLAQLPGIFGLVIVMGEKVKIDEIQRIHVTNADGVFVAVKFRVARTSN